MKRGLRNYPIGDFAILFYVVMRSEELNSDATIGIPIEIYIPEEKVAVESFAETQEIDSLKEYLCRKRGIKFVKILYRANDSEIDFAINIRKLFRSIHIFIASDVNDNVAFIRKRFKRYGRGNSSNGTNIQLKTERIMRFLWKVCFEYFWHVPLILRK